MNNKRTFFCHIGFPKAASTTLQRHIFPKSKKFRYLGKDSGLGSMDNHLLPIFNFIGSLAFETEDRIKDTFNSFHEFIMAEEIKRYNDINEEIPLLISFETFTTIMVRPVKHNFGVWVADPNTIFRRLKYFGEIFNYNIKILLIERDFKSFVHSWYAEEFKKFIKINHLESIKFYLKSDLTENNLNLGLKWFIPGKMENLLSKYFSENDIIVLWFEDLIKNPNSESRKKLEILLDLDLSPFFTIVENKRNIAPNVKIANTKKLSFLRFIHNCYKDFKHHFILSKKIKILWDDECDRLLNQIKEKYKN